MKQKIKTLILQWILNKVNNDELLNKFIEKLSLWLKGKVFAKQVFLSDVPKNTIFYSQFDDQLYVKISVNGVDNYVDLKNKKLTTKMTNQIVFIRKKAYEKGLI